MRRIYWLLIGFSLIGLVGGIVRLPQHFSLLDLLRVLFLFGVLPLIAAGLLARRIEHPRTITLPRWLLIAAIVAGCVVSLRSVRAFPNFSTTDEAIQKLSRACQSPLRVLKRRDAVESQSRLALAPAQKPGETDGEADRQNAYNQVDGGDLIL